MMSSRDSIYPDLPFYVYNYSTYFFKCSSNFLKNCLKKNKQNIAEVKNVNLFEKLASVTFLL